MNIGDIVKLRVWGEECCEVYNEIIWNWIDKCPVCYKEDALAEEHGDLYDEDQIQCSSCDSIFLKKKGSWYSGYKCEVEIIAIGNKK